MAEMRISLFLPPRPAREGRRSSDGDELNCWQTAVCLSASCCPTTHDNSLYPMLRLPLRRRFGSLRS